jgi:hypothetical protein
MTHACRVVLPCLLLSTLLALGALPAGAQDAAAAFAAEDWAKAAQGYETLTQAEPSNGEGWFRLGVSRFNLGQCPGAIAALEKAQAAGFRSLRMAMTIAACQHRDGKLDEALATLDQAVENGLPVNLLDMAPALVALRKEPRFAPVREKAERQTYPCRYEPEAKWMDFWVGEWEVRAGTGIAGQSRIEALPGGCVIVESYAATAGMVGRSLNYWDPRIQKWRQEWADDNGVVINFTGVREGGSMVFYGTEYSRGGGEGKTRMTFTPNADGTVRQLIESPTEDGKGWEPSFDGLYVRKKAGG